MNIQTTTSQRMTSGYPGTTPRSPGLPGRLPSTGRPRAGGIMANHIARHDTTHLPIFDDGLVYVGIDGDPSRRAVIGQRDFLRITARDPLGPWLTRTRWWLDEDDMLRAFSLHDRPFTEGVLVAAAVLGAKEGDVIEVPGDPLDMRLSQLRRLVA